MKRYYYKTTDGSGWLNLKSPLNDPKYIAITEEEWNAHMVEIQPKEPTEEELRKKEIQKQINEYKKLLRDTDYAVIKIAESDNEDEILALRQYYSEVIAERKRVRQLINELEGQL